MWVKREHLKDKCNIPLACRLHTNLFTVDVNLTFGGQFESGHHAQGCRFTTTRWTKQHKELSILNSKRRRLDRGEIPEIFAYIFNSNLGHRLIPENG